MENHFKTYNKFSDIFSSRFKELIENKIKEYEELKAMQSKRYDNKRLCNECLLKLI